MQRQARNRGAGRHQYGSGHLFSGSPTRAKTVAGTACDIHGRQGANQAVAAARRVGRNGQWWARWRRPFRRAVLDGTLGGGVEFRGVAVAQGTSGHELSSSIDERPRTVIQVLGANSTAVNVQAAAASVALNTAGTCCLHCDSPIAGIAGCCRQQGGGKR